LYLFWLLDVCRIILFAENWELMVVKATILIELRGIKIAATMGERCPVTANPSPIRL
tara:strand:+ start:394 stop:564 length:171 start_codon:yes stop_codon:yes gene_type:complete